MAALVYQEDVIKWIKEQIHFEEVCGEANGNTGPDLILQINNEKIYFEAIAYTKKPKGKNQSDFWKAFSQAISRLNPNSIYGKPDYIVLALPMNFWRGWRERTRILGKGVWKSIGDTFPQLCIWFVGNEEIKQFAWNESYDAVR